MLGNPGWRVFGYFLQDAAAAASLPLAPHLLPLDSAICIYRLLEKKTGEKFTCEQLIKTLRCMMMARPGEKQGYIPVYTRTEITDILHETSGFRTDYEILSDMAMKKVIRLSKDTLINSCLTDKHGSGFR